MKKVLFTPHLENLVKFNKPFMKWFQDQGWEVHYAALDEEHIPNCDRHFRVHFSRSPFRFDNIEAYFELKNIIEQEQYDLIHCHTPVGGAVTRLAARDARRRGTKVVYTAHGFHFYQGAPLPYWLLYYPVEKHLPRFTDCLVTMNQEDYRRAVQRRFKASQIVKIDGVGVNLNRFYPVAPEEKLRLREEYGFDKSDFILIYVAEFIVRKNHRFILENLHAFRERIPRLKVVFAGKGEKLDEYKEYARQSALDGTVCFMGYRQDVERLCRIADILVSCSKQEGLPVNILEGMATALPVGMYGYSRTGRFNGQWS